MSPSPFLSFPPSSPPLPHCLSLSPSLFLSLFHLSLPYPTPLFLSFLLSLPPCLPAYVSLPVSFAVTLWEMLTRRQPMLKGVKMEEMGVLAVMMQIGTGNSKWSSLLFFS